MRNKLFLYFLNSCLSMSLNPVQIDEFEQVLNQASQCLSLWEGSEKLKGSIWHSCIYQDKMAQDKFGIKSNLFTILNSHEYEIQKVIEESEHLKQKFEKISQHEAIFRARKFLEKHIEKLNLQLLNESFLIIVNWMYSPDSKLDYLVKLNCKFTVHCIIYRAMFELDVSKRKQAYFDLINIFSQNHLEHPEKTKVISFLRKLIEQENI